MSDDENIELFVSDTDPIEEPEPEQVKEKPANVLLQMRGKLN